jgi:hypothetical protein
MHLTLSGEGGWRGAGTERMPWLRKRTEAVRAERAATGVRAAAGWKIYGEAERTRVSTERRRTGYRAV